MLFITYGMPCSEQGRIPLFLVKQMVGIIVKTFISPLATQPWPITGGQNLAPDPPQRDLLLTGSVHPIF